MKSRRTTKSIIIITLIIIGLFIFCYYWFIRPMYLNNLDQHKSITLQKTQIVAFGKYPDQKGIFGIEIEIKGQSKSNVDLLISDIEGLKHGASVKGKNLDFVYKNDWYSDSCYIRILPRGEVDGKLDIHCRFLATD